MAYWMALGVDKTQTGSMDTYFNGKLAANDGNYAFLGCSTKSTPSLYHWFNSGSVNGTHNPTGSMFTPFPDSTERGKIYLVSPSVFVSDTGLPIKEGWVDLNPIPNTGDDSYTVITPSLIGPTQTGKFIAQYNFYGIDDLWDNGWRVQNAEDGAPITTKTVWDNLKNGDWDTVGLDINGANPTQAKEQIIACILAFTPKASQIWNGGVGTTNTSLRPKGALLMSQGVGQMYDTSNFKGLVPAADQEILS